ncbi:MAG: hypothetical protein LQ340_005857, partial [Diploschistes diacapsis]
MLNITQRTVWQFIVLLNTVTLSAAYWRSPNPMLWLSSAANIQRPSLEVAGATAEAGLENQYLPVADQHDYFDEARRRLAVIESSSTCKRVATVKILTTCENLQIGVHETDLENVQNLYAAHLASCALDSIKVDTSHVFAQVETETRAAEYAKSLKEVIAANGEVAKALDDFLSDNQHRISEQQRFMQDVNSFRSQLARDLEASAREVSDIFKWLTREAGDMTRELMRALSVSMREAQGEAEGLVAIVQHGAHDAEGLRDAIVSTHRTIYDGVSSISHAQELQLSRTSEQVLKLQDQIGQMVDTKLKAAIANATELVETMTASIEAVVSSIEQTRSRVEDIELRMSGLVATMPRLTSLVQLIAALKWPLVLVFSALVSWRSAVFLTAAIILFGSFPWLTTALLTSALAHVASMYDVVLSISVLYPLCIIASVTAAFSLRPRRSYVTEVSAAELQFGQPLHETHPQLLEPGELTPGISALEYANRRTRLARKLPPNSIALLAAAELKYKSGAVFYPFHQESNFFYLTGFNEPEALAVIEKSSDPDDHIFHLYLRPKDPKAEIWEGPRSGLDAATDVFNADETGSIHSLPTLLPPLLSSASSVYTNIPLSASSTSNGKTIPGIFGRFLASLSSSSETTKTGPLSSISPSALKPLTPLVHDLRVFKSEAEITLMRQIGQVSGRVFQGVMRTGWEYESDVAAYVEYEMRRQGCEGGAYVPVVAGGRNNAALGTTARKNDLLLLDAGAEKGHYITDLTRTFPVSGTYSPAQRDLYNAVLNVQRECVDLCTEKAGISLDGLHGRAEEGLRRELVGLGFDVRGKLGNVAGGSGSADCAFWDPWRLERKLMRRVPQNLDTLFPHHVGHYIGLDVHDTPGYSRSTPLRRGQCVTVEP